MAHLPPSLFCASCRIQFTRFPFLHDSSFLLFSLQIVPDLNTVVWVWQSLKKQDTKQDAEEGKKRGNGTPAACEAPLCGEGSRGVCCLQTEPRGQAVRDPCPCSEGGVGGCASDSGRASQVCQALPEDLSSGRPVSGVGRAPPLCYTGGGGCTDPGDSVLVSRAVVNLRSVSCSPSRRPQEGRPAVCPPFEDTEAQDGSTDLS